MKKSILITMGAVLPCTLFAGAPLPTPLHQWTFDTDGSDSGTGNIEMQIINNATLATDAVRTGAGALRLDSSIGPSGAETALPINWGAFANGDVRTICFWSKGPIGQQEANATLFGAGVNGTGQRFDIKYATANRVLRVEIQGTGQNTDFDLDDNIWHHIAIVIPNDGAVLGDALFYVDGNPVTNGNGNGTEINTATAIVRLGDSANAAGDRNPTGWMDDVRIYDVALSSTEIAQLIAEADAGGPSASGFEAGSDNIIVGNSTFLDWDAFALGAFTTLTITNDQDATVIDAKANTSDTHGSILVSPAVTTVYTLNLDESPVATTTVAVKTTPDLLTFGASPDLVYGSSSVTLDWTTSQAMRLEISNDQDANVVTFTTSADTQAVLDAGSVEVGPISTTTVYTLTGYLDEPGAGTAETIEATVTVQPGPDLDIVAAPSVFAGPQDVTLYFNATVIINTTEIMTGTFDGFTEDPMTPGFDLQDSLADFDTALGASTPGIYSVERLTGDNTGALTEVLSWSGDSIELADDLGSDFSWNPADYRIVTVTSAGADTLVINDGSTDIFTTTNQTVIANGSFVVSGVGVDTTFTATATITGSGSTMASVTVDADGTGMSYEEVIRADNPVGYFPFNESPLGSVIYDASGNGNHSTDIIGTLIQGETGAIGTAHRFSANETIVTGVTIDPSGDGLTMEALINPLVAATGTNTHILSNRDGAGTGRSALYLSADGRVTSFLGSSSTFSTAQALDDSWCHLAMTITYDENSGLYVARTYLDGTLVDTIEMTNPPEFADGAWVIGSHKNRQADVFWDGLLDEVALYDYALSDAQIAAHNAAFLSNAVGILAFESSARVPRNEPFDLFVKIGGASASATIDNGIGPITPGTAQSISVTPSEDVTYTLDVDGDMKSVTLQVIDPLVVTDFGLDNGSGFPFVSVDGITPGIYYQLFAADNLQNGTPIGTPFLGVETTHTFVDGFAFDSDTRPRRQYQVSDVADPVVEP